VVEFLLSIHEGMCLISSLGVGEEERLGLEERGEDSS
jgi:hypothetical protein